MENEIINRFKVEELEERLEMKTWYEEDDCTIKIVDGSPQECEE